MWSVTRGLQESFADIEFYFESCRFRDCRHQSEPGCAVKEALQNHELSLERWESYLKLHAEAKYTSDKTAYLREKEIWQKSISKFARQIKKIINILLVKKALFVRDVGCQQILKVLGVNTGIIVHIVW